LSQVAAITGLVPATARRALLTLHALGYLNLKGRDFSVTGKVLGLTAGYIEESNSEAESVVSEPQSNNAHSARGGIRPHEVDDLGDRASDSADGPGPTHATESRSQQTRQRRSRFSVQRF
jgi:hypothetical protein